MQLAKSELANRRRAIDSFSLAIVRSPAWDMMLDLYAAEHNGYRSQTTYLIQAADAPHATGLRTLTDLEEQGIIVRFQLPGDRRSRYVRLTEAGRARLEEYLLSREADAPSQVACEARSAGGCG